MLFHDGTYYWYGENKEGRTWLPKANKSWDDYRVDLTGIRCYTSRDLYMCPVQFEAKGLRLEWTEGWDLSFFDRGLSSPSGTGR